MKATYSIVAIVMPFASAYVAKHRPSSNTLPKRPGAYPRCDLSCPVHPSHDGIVNAQEIFAWEKAIRPKISRLQSIVQVPTVVYNDMGDVDKDERWKPLGQVAVVLNSSYPNIHHYTSPEVVHKYGHIYTVEGSNPDLKPIFLTAHQDVIPVDEDTLDEWTHSPFKGYYEQRNGYLYGRGTADDKSALTGLMSALEALLAQDYDPRRAVILAFGFDHGISVQSYHAGGDNFTPPPHSAIGVMSEIVTTIENNLFDARIGWDSPVHQRVRLGGLDGAARFSVRLSPETHYLFQTSQAVDLIAGGETINTLPEYVTLGVSHRLTPQDTIGSRDHSVTGLVQNIVNK
ncbi:cps1-gly-x carboxypeptidase yscs precursor [Fusarium flagelliforme]|uniref:Cps1-gly-x carboxypeptidase yscs n=1 Tax=Fusarium flagelliforme TaxID=2675880 RepID=A0A395M6A7_9HYPO|nr:cps1-gly-x carboxypeptidase yscs precursor [Fusarium flagelliforme]